VQEIEQQGRSHRVFLILGREHTLRDVSAAAGLRAGIPDIPPLHRDRQNQHGHQGRKPALSGREHRHVRLHLRLGEELLQRSDASYVGGFDGVNCGKNRADHGDRILVEIGPDRAGESA